MSYQPYAINFPWSEYEEKAKGMTSAELFYALEDIKKALPAARANDRLFMEESRRGGCTTSWRYPQEGWYTDEASVYLREIQWRREEGA